MKGDEATLLLLQTNHDSSNYFANYLRSGTHPTSEEARTLADHELLCCIEDCEKFVSEWQNNKKSLNDLVSLLNNKLTFLFHEIGDETLVYTVFEVLNSRGLPVSWFDRLKSILMAIIFEANSGNRDELIAEVHRLWTDIYDCIGMRVGLSTESLRFAATFKTSSCPSRPLSEENATKFFRDYCGNDPVKVIETTEWLMIVTKAVDQLLADYRRNAVTEIAQARMVAIAVYLRSDFTKEETSKILRRWENVTFRIYGMYKNDARTSVGDYVKLAWKVINAKLSVDEILDELTQIGVHYPIRGAVERLREMDCYTGWQEELRYFFYRYEEHLSVKAGQVFNNEQWIRIWEKSAADSIEHIYPQSLKDAQWIHWIGNLLVLPPRLNSALKDKRPREKAQAYTRTGLLIAQETASKISNGNWGKKKIKLREESLLNWAMREWAD